MTKLYRKAAPVSAKPVKAPATNSRPSVYDEVTAAIIRQLEAGVAPWAKPWKTGAGNGSAVMPLNAVSGKRYSGINVLILWGAMIERGYQSPYFVTFKQALDLGGSVMKGEKGVSVCFADRFVPQAEKTRAAEESREERAIPFLRRFTVFNVEQCQNLPERFFAKAEPVSVENQWAAGETLIKASGADYRLGGNKAFYSPSHDFVQMPPLPAFPEPLDYYRTAAHELTHWTGAACRLARKFGYTFGTADYAREELVAEMGAAFVCATLGIEPALNHASYLANWIKVLRDDNRAIFKAASLATKAADFLLAKLDSYTPPEGDKLAVPVLDPEPVEAPAEPVEGEGTAEPVAALPEPVAAPVEPVLPEGIVWRSPHKSPEEKAEWTRRFNIRQAAYRAGWEAFEAGKARVAFFYLRSVPTADHDEAVRGWITGYDMAKRDGEQERSALREHCPLFRYDFEPVAEPFPLPLGAEPGRTVTREGIPCRVYSRPDSEATKDVKARLALVMAGQVDWESVEGLPGFTYEPARHMSKEPPRIPPSATVVPLAKLPREVRAYYAGGHRLVVSGVPCRIARKPCSRNHAAMLRQSLAELAA